MFAKQYNSQELPPEVMLIRNGSMHTVYSLGRIKHPLLGEQHLALKLANFELRFTAAIPELMASNIAGYEYAFKTGGLPPEFLLAISSLEHNFHGNRCVGLLLEDITAGKTIELEEETADAENEFCFQLINGRKIKRFIDPVIYGYPSEFGLKYLEERAHLSLP
ncbi:MAG TPA: hypothetical protein VJI98_03630 [Candidatus Nanoarchaeia archaeon]|nr:hypothetical protein [Candidatus Nanoarchaeia archaeon]